MAAQARTATFVLPQNVEKDADLSGINERARSSIKGGGASSNSGWTQKHIPEQQQGEEDVEEQEREHGHQHQRNWQH
jgi:hypothetical protein